MTTECYVAGRGDSERTIWDVVCEQALLAPADIAVHDNRDISYSELVSLADDCAAALGAVAAPGALVALEDAGHAAAVVTMLAGARLGCAILPLSAADPPLRRQRILEDARPAAMVRESADGSSRLAATPAPGAETRSSGLRHAAYVLYTSGSTGRPKGVVVSHAALLSRLAGLAAMPGMSAGESMMAMTALSFDIVMAELLLPLTVGGRVEVAPAAARVDPAVFARFAAARAPDIVQATPSFWRLALRRGWAGLPSGRVWCGGEPMTRSLAEQLAPRCAQLWNLYGPTEATIWASAALVKPGDDVSIGNPLPGTRLYLEPIAGSAGAGEIIIYGAGLADGYLNAPDITRRSFPVLSTPHGDRTCYRTGDQAIRRPDGTLKFLGRIDGQVKLRGHRIELGEIEAALEEHAQVTEAAAVIQDAADPARAAITAFVVTTASDLTVSQLRSFLAERLPLAARPARIHVIDTLPHTSAGKVDRVLLAAQGSSSR